MGVGKTTIGKLLSKELGLEFFDLDIYIENRYRKSVKEIFERRGEEAFRKIEREMLHEVATFQKVLIATGGGTPCYFDNMSYMMQQGVTIYLKTSVEQLVLRLLTSKGNRPLIQGKSAEDLKMFVSNHLGEREKYYLQSHIVYETHKLITLEHVHDNVREIKEALGLYLLEEGDFLENKGER